MRLVPDLMLVCGDSGAITYQSPAAEYNWGYADGALLGVPATRLVHADDLQTFQQAWRLKAGSAQPVVLRARDGAGAWRTVHAFCAGLEGFGTAVTLKDVTANTLYDPVTGIPALSLLQDRLQHALNRAERGPELIALLLIDLQGGDPPNNALGEALLVMAAGRLRSAVRAHDTVGRVSESRFAVILEQLANRGDAGSVARAIAGQLRRPFTVLGREVTLTSSIGSAVGSGKDPGANGLWTNAETALERAGSEGSGFCAVFSDPAGAEAVDPAEAETVLQDAIQRREISILYQPIVALPSGRVSAIEATPNWTSGAPPEALSTQTGQWVVGRWVLARACLQLAEWQRRFPSGPSMTLCMRMTPAQLERPFAVADVMQALLEAGLPATDLRIGIANASAAARNPAVVRVLQELDDLGIQGTVIDFDPESDTVAILKRLPVRGLTLDRACLDRNPASAEPVRQAVAVARALFLDVTADGVSTPAHADLVARCGAACAQGDHFGAPAGAEAMTEWLDATIDAGRARRR